jgi:transcriptional regulator with XRE-family HTH domain
MIGELLKSLRLEKGLSELQVSEQSGISLKRVQDMESGAIDFTLGSTERYLNAISMTLSDLLLSNNSEVVSVDKKEYESLVEKANVLEVELKEERLQRQQLQKDLLNTSKEINNRDKLIDKYKNRLTKQVQPHVESGKLKQVANKIREGQNTWLSFIIQLRSENEKMLRDLQTQSQSESIDLFNKYEQVKKDYEMNTKIIQGLYSRYVGLEEAISHITGEKELFTSIDSLIKKRSGKLHSSKNKEGLTK